MVDVSPCRLHQGVDIVVKMLCTAQMCDLVWTLERGCVLASLLCSFAHRDVLLQ